MNCILVILTATFHRHIGRFSLKTRHFFIPRVIWSVVIVVFIITGVFLLLFLLIWVYRDFYIFRCGSLCGIFIICLIFNLVCSLIFIFRVLFSLLSHWTLFLFILVLRYIIFLRRFFFIWFKFNNFNVLDFWIFYILLSMVN